MLITQYLLELREYGPKPLLGASAWTVSAAWLGLKDVGWLSAIGLVCIATLALSLVTTKHARQL
jgi:hypothetical protein